MSTSTASSPDSRSPGSIRSRTTQPFERIYGLESLAALPRVDDLGDDVTEIRERLEAVAEKRPA